MSATITLPVELENLLAKKAAVEGINVEQFALNEGAPPCLTNRWPSLMPMSFDLNGRVFSRVVASLE